MNSKTNATVSKPHDVTLATVGRRAIALTIDTGLVVGYAIMLTGLTGYLSGYTPFGVAGAFVRRPSVFLIVIASWFLYFFLSEWLAGQTLGKLCCGIHVQTRAGERPGFWAAAWRNLFRVVDAFPFVWPYLVGTIVAYNSKHVSRVGDMVARTEVVVKHSAFTLEPAPRDTANAGS